MSEQTPRPIGVRLDLDAGPTDVRVVVVAEDSVHPLVDTTGDDWLMTAPHLLIREVAVFCLLVAAYALMSHFWDAPLLDIADPTRTPNPAKAPWYFLGLQELLHYYPPIVSGVVLPGVVAIALFIVPYFEVNVVRAPLWSGPDKGRQLVALVLSALVACAVFVWSSPAGPVWPLVGTTLIVLVAMLAPLGLGRTNRLGDWLATRSLPFWIFTWFALSFVTLTVIGVMFRGPGWSFTLPWEVGIYE